ncbi:hypothetical protein ACKWRH_05980 [Bradyrhizobium sp. Pa8]|uniref:hypothetical protein n=1 Tax=Bradyrhizobium sp. Pa8 TaxID=3386552 RepID=UPI00403F77DD
MPKIVEDQPSSIDRTFLKAGSAARAPRIGMSVRTAERRLAAAGEPEHIDGTPTNPSSLILFRDYLQQRWEEGERRGPLIVD